MSFINILHEMNTKVYIFALACLFAFTLGEQCRHRNDCSTTSCKRPVFVVCIDNICTCAVPTHVDCTTRLQCIPVCQGHGKREYCLHGSCYCHNKEMP
ncbi:Hypothetical predicted protein [Mytilus galloprovincialis]|uniref:Uncharacterized protein n=2 Tax=Mytilus galloprovincialis TaxID=29158 RepID=A0A8B6HPX1_MYTGA|nr:Hypothetical predicted protein [Mytilus galloprovincialis]